MGAMQTFGGPQNSTFSRRGQRSFRNVHRDNARTSRHAAAVFAPLFALACSAAGPAPPAPPGPASAAPRVGQPEPPPTPQPATEEPEAPKWQPVDTDPQPGSGRDFKTEATLLYRGSACGLGEGDLPVQLSAAVVDSYCDRLRPSMQAFRDHILSKAAPFFAGIRPQSLPPRVVYPLGVGDLLWALIVFPDALEYTTIPIEPAGDVRQFGKASKRNLEKGLKAVEEPLNLQLRGGWNWVRKMDVAHKGGVPEQIVYALVAMVVMDYEPLSLRYFVLGRDGSVTYLSDGDFDQLSNQAVKSPHDPGKTPSANPFSNVEIRFRKREGGAVKVYRHLTANLTDAALTRDPQHLTKDPSVLAHLEAKGQVSALMRATAYLIWYPHFSELRNYLTSHLVWMPSDATGIPPTFAREAGLVQEAYGEFTGVYEPGAVVGRPDFGNDFAQLFAEGPARPLEFLFGYPDQNKNPHLVITRRAE